MGRIEVLVKFQVRSNIMGLGFFSHVLDGFAHIYDHKGNLTKVSASRLPPGAKPGQDIDVRTSPSGNVRVGAVGNSVKTNTTTDRQQYAMKRLMSPGHGPEGKGWSAVQAAGMVGRWMQESYPRLDTKARGDLSIPGASVGIGQWNRERKAAMIAFAKDRGGATNFDAQIDFGDWEIRNSPRERLAFAALAGAKNPEQASAAMMHYERPRGYSPGNPRGGHGFHQTVQYANHVMSNYDPSYTPQGVNVGGGAADNESIAASDPSAADPGALDNSTDPALDTTQDTTNEPSLGETLGSQFQEAFQAPEEDPSRGQARRQGIADIIQQGQQASAGSLPRLPTIEELYGGNG